MSGTQVSGPPSPQLFFETITAFQPTEALKAGVQLEVFTAIGEGNQTGDAIARRCQASERGVRILCDTLTIIGFLHKDGARYSLSQDAAVFLDQRSPAYIGGAIHFLLAPAAIDGFRNSPLRFGRVAQLWIHTVSRRKIRCGSILLALWRP